MDKLRAMFQYSEMNMILVGAKHLHTPPIFHTVREGGEYEVLI